MYNYSRLNNLIKEISLNAVNSTNPTNVVFGIVISDDPLIIEIENKLQLNKNQLILSRNVTDYKTKISFDNPDIKNVNVTSDYPTDMNKSSPFYQRFTESVKNEITIYNSLEVDEEVILIRMVGGQKFIVWDRRVII